MKKILVILDGAADRPCKELDGKTPLEAAYTPNLDYMAKNGKGGYIYIVDKETAPESDVAVMAILGYNPYKYHTGRGPLEAYGAGIKLGKDFLALRTNFATVNGNKNLIERRAGRTFTTEEGKILEKEINKINLGVPFMFKHTTEHRGVLVLKGKFSTNISNTDPGYERKGNFGVASNKNNNTIRGCIPLDDSELSRHTANTLNYFTERAYSVLKNHEVNRKRIEKGLYPANIILTRDPGNKLPKLEKKKNWCAVVGLPLERGIAKLAGIKVLKFEYPEIKDYDVDKHLMESLKTEIKYSKYYLKKYFNRFDGFYLHFKGFDVMGHDGKAVEKEKMIRYIDAEFFSFLRKLNAVIAVTSDHATPCSLKRHTSDPVPLLIYGKGKDSIKRFNEKECRKGKIKGITGKSIVKLIA